MSFAGFREPDKASVWFGQLKGCFQTPIKDVEPQQTSIMELADLEKIKKVDSGTDQHPRTGHCSKYIVGDRFHESVKPHKDPRYTGL